MSTISIHENKTSVINGSSSLEIPAIEGIELSDFSYIAIKAYKNRNHLLSTHSISVRKWHDYDGWPLEDFFELHYNASDNYRDDENDRLSVTFNSTSSDEHDYVAMASTDTTTAYKRGRKGPDNETKFKIYSVFVKVVSEGSADVWLQKEVVRLKAVIDSLELTVSTLPTWADSGLDMQVYCSTFLCRTHSNVAIIPNVRIKQYVASGLSLEDLKQKLKCQRCGAKCHSTALP